MKKFKVLALCLSAISLVALSSCGIFGSESSSDTSSDASSVSSSDSSSSSVEVHTHDYTYNEAQLPGKTEEGRWAYYSCDGCDKIFDLNMAETTTDALKISAFLSENNVYASAALLNDYEDGMISVYDSKSGVSSSDIDDEYVVAIDAEGKIIYASHFGGAGYGGPADGFYHDGTYAVQAGAQCGIFYLYEDFAGWPNVTEDGLNAWTRYEINVPDGYYILSGSAQAMKGFIAAFTGSDVTETDLIGDGAYNNTLFESLGKGIYNDTVIIDVIEGAGQAVIDLSILEAEKVAGVAYSVAGGSATAFTANEDGTYEAQIELFNWENIVLTYTNSALEETVIWYDNTTISGNVTAAETDGCDWTKNLYHEGETKAWYHYGGIASTIYKFVYNPTEGTLAVTVIEEGTTYSVAGGTPVAFIANEDGTYAAQVTLSGWQNIALTYTNSALEAKTIWYDNTTVSGTVTAADVIGCDWTQNLFHEAGEKVWLHNGGASAMTYKLLYNPADNTLAISMIEEGLTYSVAGGSATAFTKNEDGTYTAQVTLSGWQNVALNYTNSELTTTTIWYDNTTVSGTVTAVETEGCDWTTNLFHEGDTKAWFHNGGEADTTYQLVYDPTASTLVVSIVSAE